jgi:hypothetical protein
MAVHSFFAKRADRFGDPPDQALRMSMVRWIMRRVAVTTLMLAC